MCPENSVLRHQGHIAQQSRQTSPSGLNLEIKTEFGEKIKYKFAEIINESADQILDRLRNGDVIRDTKTCELDRVPIKGRDMAIIGGVAFDKLRLAENQPTNIVAHENSKEHLQRLIDRFAAIGEADKRGDDVEVERLKRRLGVKPIPLPPKDKDS